MFVILTNNPILSNRFHGNEIKLNDIFPHIEYTNKNISFFNAILSSSAQEEHSDKIKNKNAQLKEYFFVLSFFKLFELYVTDMLNVFSVLILQPTQQHANSWYSQLIELMRQPHASHSQATWTCMVHNWLLKTNLFHTKSNHLPKNSQVPLNSEGLTLHHHIPL